MNKRYVNSMLEANTKVESIVASNFYRYSPVYYIKAEGEVDLVVIDDNTFTPIEIKWSEQLRPKELKQIKKYKNPIVLTKFFKEGLINNIKTLPVPLYLLKSTRSKRS